LPNESEEESTKTPKKIPSQLLVTQDFYDLREIISMSVTTKFEEAVLKLKEYGYNRSEIAELLKSRPKEITETMEVIEFRLRRLLKDNHYGSYT
jgi:DNA-directed RNA polymerase specialized sigma24 family protein